MGELNRLKAIYEDPTSSLHQLSRKGKEQRIEKIDASNKRAELNLRCFRELQGVASADEEN